MDKKKKIGQVCRTQIQALGSRRDPTITILSVWPEAQCCLGPPPKLVSHQPAEADCWTTHSYTNTVSELGEGRPLLGNVMHVLGDTHRRPVLQQPTGIARTSEVKSTVPSAR